MIHRAGPHVFHEHNVAFHLNRDNVFCPWKVIGVYTTYDKIALCRYMYEFQYIQDSFKDEVKLAGDLCGTRDFLDSWRKAHSDINSVITPVIRYCSLSNTPYNTFAMMIAQQLGSDFPYRIAKIAAMLKSHKGFFPMVFSSCKPKESAAILAELQKAGLV